MKRQLLFALVLIAALLLATGSVAAKDTRTPFTGFYYGCVEDPPPPADRWTTGNGRVLHVRGEPGFGYARSETDLYNAYTTGPSNYDLNLVNGSGGFQGNFLKKVDGVDGGWQGTAGGHFKDGLLYINVVGHGWGELAGMKYFAKFVPAEDPPPLEDGLCPQGVGDVSAVTGVILDPHGVWPE